MSEEREELTSEIHLKKEEVEGVKSREKPNQHRAYFKRQPRQTPATITNA